MAESRRRAGGLPIHATVFLDEVPLITEKGNVFRVEYSSGDAVFAVAVTPHILLRGIAVAHAAYQEWADRQKGATPIGRVGG